MARITTLAGGLYLPESPRWRDGRIYFVDGPAIRRLVPGEPAELVAQLDCPVLLGLVFEADGSILTNDSVARRVMRIAVDGSCTLVADLSVIARTMLNEISLMPDGTLYVGEIGFDVIGGAEPVPSRLIRISPDGRVTRVGPPIRFPNGMTDSSEPGTFYVAEFIGGAIWRVTHAGEEPVAERVANDLGDGVDGIALGPGGRLWFANMHGGQLYELDETGAKIREIATGFGNATSLAFDPAGGRLFATVLEQLPTPETMGRPMGALIEIDIHDT